ncbi:glycosyltransferase family 4 protein [Ectobacillus ponti]|uniref:Glycosyltransferase family 4 protein n=1 Tax=Ectobacillus ponti TaxID=2961894 RepID=A0AA41XE78_9BACI|nr:glycosyltransferase family 4 protein [Ectobacillus ponti]MCP8971310.1 glycosyltransferase family 4 protein [Ectobacillus ponti]
MHILFFTPYFNQPRGNSTTIKRLVHFLQLQQANISVIPYLEQDNWHMPEADLIHVLHATRFIQWAREHDVKLDRPYLVTMGGTDINVDLQKGIHPDVFTFLEQAHAITVFTEDALEKVQRLRPEWGGKTIVIPQGVWLPWQTKPLPEQLVPRILLPAGLRSVKDVLHTLPAMDELVHTYPNLQFTILGSNLDQNVYEQVQTATATRWWLRYAGVVPLETMKLWYEQADVVLNTSRSEGQSLALMEAMAAGRPVIARRNDANVQLVQHSETGWLYGTMEEFMEAMHEVVQNPFQRRQVIQRAREWVLDHASPEREADAYFVLYRQILEK